MQPVEFYQWQKQFFEPGRRAFIRPSKNTSQQTISQLEQKIFRKNKVLAELMAEHVA